ncbi:meteorin-like protein [Limulus polyphemus]|uniref:Meteorin-like protein n=1 Tax=Limulus polyphemus TaxID=6850 RepID=A0ABM1C615_LIMPO|nr:meteorin-like protein [Limulus polyphemus]
MGMQLARAGPWQTAVPVIYVLFALVRTGRSSSAYTGDDCDWVGSGLREDASREVQPIYLRCAHGHVEWNYPRGALQVFLRHGTSGREFRGCLRTSKHFNGAQIYVEGHRKLHLMYSKTDGKHPELLRCFTSYHGQVALYVEAEPVNNTLQKEVASFSYDLQPVSPEALFDDLDECRPCTEEEMLRFYCTSIFVIRGTISSLRNENALLRTELSVKVTKVFRDSEGFVVLNSRGVTTETVLYRPLKCGTKAGSGEFVFMGRIMLGNPVLHCAPRLAEWHKVRRKAMLEGTNQCQLD